MHRIYAAYGLQLHSDAEIPGLMPGDASADPDVRVRLNDPPTHLAAPRRQRWYQSPAANDPNRPNLVISRVGPDGSFHFHYADGTEFLIGPGGREVWCTRPAEVSPEEAAVYLRGPILGMVLRLRGIVCLHASTVAIGSSAVAFVGSAGAGKSTTAAAFLTLGFRLLADDVAALRCEGDRVVVMPGPSRLSLWSDAGAVLFGSSRLPRVTPADGLSAWWDKRYVDVDAANQYQRTPLPLTGVYVLGRRELGRDKPMVETMGPKDAFLALTEDAYVNYALDEAMRAREFAVLGHLVRTVPVRWITRVDDAGRVPDLCRAIIEDHSAACTRFTTTAR